MHKNCVCYVGCAYVQFQQIIYKALINNCKLRSPVKTVCGWFMTIMGSNFL